MFTSRLVGLELKWLGPTIMFTSRLVGLQLQYGWVPLLCLPLDWLVHNKNGWGPTDHLPHSHLLLITGLKYNFTILSIFPHFFRFF